MPIENLATPSSESEMPCSMDDDPFTDDLDEPRDDLDDDAVHSEIPF
jgi:hypothetical protein